MRHYISRQESDSTAEHQQKILRETLPPHAIENAETEDGKLIAEIKRRAEIYAWDNIYLPTGHQILLIENSMLLGASIQLELAASRPIVATNQEEQ